MPQMEADSGNMFAVKLALQQRVLPAYRAPFIDLLSRSCGGGLSVFAGLPRADEMIRSAEGLDYAVWEPAGNRHIFTGDWYLLWQRGIVDWLNLYQPDVLILEANPRYLSNRSALSWMHSRGRPVIGWALGAPEARGLMAPIRRFLRTDHLRRFDALIAYSTRGADEYRALGIPSERVFTAFNAVATAPAQQPGRERIGARMPRVLFVGRLQRRKRLDLLLMACAHLDREVELVIVGDGPARDEFQDLAKNCFPQAQFVGEAYGERLRSWFEWADVFVLPGTGGLAVQQAMTAGLPVIVAEGDGTQADLVASGNGWLVTPGDQTQLTETLRDALGDPDELLKRGKLSYDLSLERFNIEAMVAVFLNAIRMVMDK